MQLRFEKQENKFLPPAYVLIGVFGGTSNFPMCVFYVLECWWESFKLDPEIVIPCETGIEVLNSQGEVLYADRNKPDHTGDVPVVRRDELDNAG